MDKRLVDTVNSMVKEMMGAASGELSKMQSQPVGREMRSQKEIGDMIGKLQSLPREERQSRMEEIANLSGHQGDKIDNCGLCTYLSGAMRGK